MDDADSAASVAIVGMACRFPGAGSVTAYWDLLRGGVEGISHFRPADLVAAGADPDLVRRPDFVPAKGVIADAERFDWSYFGYSRAEAASIDPQHRVFLECASAAIDDAGIDPTRFPGWIGVYAGAESVRARGDLGSLAEVIGQEKDFLTTRVAYKLGLRGPAITVQTACSTSLTAVHLAVQSLLGYECDAALAGGVAAEPRGRRGYVYRDGGILSPDGHCRPFDARAAGTVPSEGVGIVVLKRLADALRDGDRIAAVILGSAVNNDGGDKIGYTAPAIPGQRDAVRLAQKLAGVDPADLGYVEAHGTGTRLGDPVEIQALTDVFQEATDATGWCWLGAVKSNLGHTGAAAGVAGLIKTALMLEHRELVPTLHFETPNPLLHLENTPFRVCTSTSEWPGTPLAAVSSFGVGGTNAHVVLAGPPERARPAPPTGPRLLALSAASPDALDRLRQDLAGHLRSATAGLPEVARTLADRRRYRHRQTVVAAEPAEAARLLAGEYEPAGSLERVAFLFPGQGTLRTAAGAAPYRLLAGFRGYFDEIRAAAPEVDLSPVVDAAAGDPDWFTDTVHQQLGLFAIGYALGKQLVDWGIEPVAMFGNSIGEYAAATLAGVWRPEDAATLVRLRATAMRDTEPGRMAAVDADEDEVADRIAEHGDVAIAVSGPGRVIVSGRQEAVSDLLAGGALAGLRTQLLDTRGAFHSAAMDQAAEALREAVAAVPAQAPRLRLVSNATGDWADPNAVRGAGYWADQLRRPVQLVRGMATVLAAGCDTFVEMGPGTSMSGGLRRHRDWDPRLATVPLFGRSDGDAERALLGALGSLWELGAEISLEAVGERPLRCSLPPHPFDSQIPDEDAEPDAVPNSVSDSVSDSARPTVSGAGPGQEAQPELARLWCRALGVPTVRDEDDFFAGGGDSLMAVHLVSQVREHIGADVSVAEFTGTPTFGRLTELAEQAAGTPAAPGVVTLRGGGVGRPLFLAADALGTSSGCRVLAELLPGQHPVYGLEPVAARTSSRIEALAAEHVAAVRGAQPRGPYAIGGWSFGAVVAHEMARQLTERGERVEVLVCLDGFVPHGRRLPLAAHPAFLANSLRLQLSAVLGVGPVGARIRRAPELRRRFLGNLAALLRYRPAPVPCKAVLFKAGSDERATARLRRRLSALYSEVRVHPVGGGHWSMLAEPHAGALARLLSSELGSAES